MGVRDAGTEADVVCFATQGSGHRDEVRIEALLAEVDAETLRFDRSRKARTALALLGTLIRRRPDLVVMEGTGVAGGVALIAARLLGGVPFVVSSGDAVGPFVKLAPPRLAPVAALYERLLCRLCAGYIGWTPYLVGRALTFGAPRAMTAAGFCPESRQQDRKRRRAELGIPAEAIVFGLVGSLQWSEGIEYCYGLELVEALRRTDRSDLRVLVVGDGNGLERLREVAGEELGRRVLLPGRVPEEEVMSYLAAVDVASLPQSVDRVGSFRYTTKIAEYLSARLPIVTGQIPLAYDFDDGWIERLGGEAPWDPRYVEELAALMRKLTPERIAAWRRALPGPLPAFDRARQQRQVAGFLADLLSSRRQ